MPTYEYECKRCKAIAEVQHGINENPGIKCMRCRRPMTRIISGGAGVIFRGDNWPGQDIKRAKEKKNGR